MGHWEAHRWAEVFHKRIHAAVLCVGRQHVERHREAEQHREVDAEEHLHVAAWPGGGGASAAGNATTGVNPCPEAVVAVSRQHEAGHHSNVQLEWSPLPVDGMRRNLV